MTYFIFFRAFVEFDWKEIFTPQTYPQKEIVLLFDKKSELSVVFRGVI